MPCQVRHHDWLHHNAARVSGVVADGLALEKLLLGLVAEGNGWAGAGILMPWVEGLR